MEPSLSLCRAIRSALINDGPISSLVGDRITDAATRSENFPSIVIGEGQSVLEPITMKRSHARLFIDIHVWTNVGGLATVKNIAFHASRVLKTIDSIEDHQMIDFYQTGTRYMRDPDKKQGHAVLTVEALVEVDYAIS